MNDHNPYAAPQTQDTRAVEYIPLPAVTVDPLTVRSLSWGALALGIISTPVVILFFALFLDQKHLPVGIVLCVLGVLAAVFSMAKQQASPTSRIWFWLAVTVQVLGTIGILILAVQMKDVPSGPNRDLTLLGAYGLQFSCTILFVTVGLWTLGRKLGASALRATSFGALLGGLCALINLGILWLLEHWNLKNDLGALPGFFVVLSIPSAYISMLAMFYFAWQLPNEMRRRLQRNLPDEIQLPMGYDAPPPQVNLDQLLHQEQEPHTD